VNKANFLPDNFKANKENTNIIIILGTDKSTVSNPLISVLLINFIKSKNGSILSVSQLTINSKNGPT
jgi:hypothetical protein